MEGVFLSDTKNRESDRRDLRVALEHAEDAQGRTALSRLLSRYREKVYLWCFGYLRDHERALEMAQEVFMRALNSYQRLDENARFDSWLFIIARNRCFSELRRPSLLVDDSMNPEMLLAPTGNPERAIEEAEEEKALLTLISRHLDPMEQQALALRCFERQPIESITGILGLESASGARGLLQRARRKLRAALQERKKVEGES